MDLDVFGLNGKRALVVGGGFGIGRASALLLARVGADVAVADLDEQRAIDVVKEIETVGRRATALTGDVTERASAEAIVAGAADFHGGLDVLINMVGTAAWAKLLEVDDATWQLDLTRNLTQHLYVGTAAARRMIDQGTGGRIAVVASVSGLYGAPNHGAYGAAKAGVMDLVRTMAQEWGPLGIRVNGVAPDMIATPRVLAAYADQGADPDSAAQNDGAPLGRFGTPEEIAGPLVFLVSDLAGFMTGQTLVVDGGQRAAFPHVRGTGVMR
ncbi:MAG TPA: SDR family NAD(P)-dependent oxidoreductase [Acidimicrobiales bacterium]|jgi:2-deoxy-D-gluconate 3-dehydrogenase|nr:SDR family NAD(P)-dependent oxidoreductase [Acidimicrobiales bacterium]